MITKEYIDGTPSIQTLLVKLVKIPGVVKAWADVVTDPILIEKAHSESIMLNVHVHSFKTTSPFTGSHVNLDPTATVKYQILGFAMPPEAYNSVEAGHNGIVNAMTGYVNNYFATGITKNAIGENVPVQVPKIIGTPIPEVTPSETGPEAPPTAV